MTTASVKISTDMSASDLKVLRDFHDRVLILSKTKLVKGSDSGIKANLKINAETGFSVNVALPPEEQLAEFLMAFRFFYLKKESTFFPRIVNLVGKYSDESYRQVANLIKQQWSDSLFKKAMGVKLNGKNISSDYLIDLWFNAHYFHNDEKKKAELEELNSLLQNDFCKFMFVDSVYNASDVVRRFHAGIGSLFLPAGTVI